MNTRGRDLDLLLVVVLGALTLLPLATTYAGFMWWVVGLAAVLAAATGVAVATSHPRGLAWVAPLTLVGYLLAALPLTARADGVAAWLPHRDSLGLVIRGTVSAWDQVIGTLPLVESRGVPLLVPLILGLIPTVASAALALGTRSPVGPVVPVLVGIATSFALGRGDLRQWPVGVAFAVVSLVWVTLRAGREREVRTPLTRPRLVSMAAVTVVAALVAGTTVSGSSIDTDPLVLRDQVAHGMDTTAVPSLLTGFRRYTEPSPGAVDNVHRRRLVTVTGGERGLRLRFACLDWFDGSQWRANPDSSPTSSSSRYLRIGDALDNPAQGPLVKVRVRVNKGWRSNWVPTAGALQELGFDLRRRRSDRREELRYNVETQSALLPTWLRRGDNYWFAARLPDERLTPDLGVGPDLDPEIYERAAFVDRTAEGFLAQHEDPISALLAAAKQLRRKGRYSDGAVGWETKFSDGHDVERLGELFLFAPQIVGNDEQYAAALALLAYRMRIPARVVIGALLPASGVVKGRHVHAWVEVQVADGSWRTIDTKTFLGTKKPERKEERKRKPDPMAIVPKKPRGKPPAQQPQQQPPKRDQQPDQKQPSQDLPSPWWLLLLLPLLIPSAKAVRRAIRRTRSDESQRIVGGWDEFVDLARDLSIKVPLVATRPVQAQVLSSAPDLGEVDPDQLAALADLQTFAPTPPTQVDADDYWTAMMARRQEVLGSLTAARRIKAWFNPASLMPRRRPD